MPVDVAIEVGHEILGHLYQPLLYLLALRGHRALEQQAKQDKERQGNDRCQEREMDCRRPCAPGFLERTRSHADESPSGSMQFPCTRDPAPPIRLRATAP